MRQSSFAAVGVAPRGRALRDVPTRAHTIFPS